MRALPSRSSALRVRPVKRDVARAFVARHHSHHRAHLAERIALGAYVGSELVGVVVLGRPHAAPLDDDETWEVTRHCCGLRAPRYAASRLLGHTTRVGLSAGLTLLVSYTRIDERGSCYLAANWRPVAITTGRDATLTEREPLEADVVEGGVGGPRVEIRHPRLESRGVLWLVAIIGLEPAPAITYAVPAYRQTIELVLRRALPARAA